MKNPKSDLPRRSEVKAGIRMTKFCHAGRRPKSAGTPRTTHFKRALLAALLLSTLNSQLSTWAQGTAFTYQGRFTDNGSPYTGVVEVQPTLWDAASGGSQVAANSPAQIAVGVTNGLFVLPLNFASNFPGADRWLQLDVRTTLGAFTPLTPRQQLTPTPYAMTAGNLTGTLPAVQLSGTVANERLSTSVSLLGQSIDSAEITDGTIANADVSASAAIVDTKLATIVTPGKVADSALSVGVSLLGQSIESAEIANGTIVPADVNTASFSNTFWRIGGNAGTNPTNGAFLGTTDNQPLEIKVNGLRALRIEAATNAFGNIPNIVGGHSANIVSNGFVGAVIGGGGHSNAANRVGNNFATVVGGIDNTASGYVSTAMGVTTTASGTASTAMGASTSASGSSSTAMGSLTTASGFASTAMGYRTTANEQTSTAMGDQTTASGDASTAMGNQTTASGFDSTAMGLVTTASGTASTAMGGYTTASGTASTAMGSSTTASGSYSTAMGHRAKANHDGSFVWADSQTADFASMAANQFLIRAGGGVGIGTTSPQTALQVSRENAQLRVHDPRYNRYWNIYTEALASSANSGNLIFQNYLGNFVYFDTAGVVHGASDRRLKQDIAPLGTVLDRLLQLRPVSYRMRNAEDDTPRMIGFIAQEVEPLFPEVVGEREGMKSLAYSELVPVTVGAIQELNQKLQQKETQIAVLQKQNSDLEKRLTEIEQRVDSLTERVSGGAR